MVATWYEGAAMSVTVEQVLKLGALTQARVLAGSQGLSRTVSSVTVGEVPDIAEWLSGGEIVLSTMFALTNDTDRQRDFCRRIMAAGASALFVKPKRFVGAFPLDILEIGNHVLRRHRRLFGPAAGGIDAGIAADQDQPGGRITRRSVKQLIKASIGHGQAVTKVEILQIQSK